MNKITKIFLYALMFFILFLLESCDNKINNIVNPNDNVDYHNPNVLVSYKFGGFGNGYPIKCPNQHPINEENKVILWGNSGEFKVGWVEFDNFIKHPDTTVSFGKLHIIYHFDYQVMNSPWKITKIYFHIGDKLSDIPHNENGIIPEKCGYVYSGIDLDTIKNGTHSFWYDLPQDVNEDGYYIFANAVGCQYGGVEGFNMYLPNHIVQCQINRNSPYSYHKVTFLNNTGGILGNGPYESFCIDPDLYIYPPVHIRAKLYSSYEPLPTDLKVAVDGWENLDLINWVINNYPVGSTVQQRSYSIPVTSAHWPFPDSNFSAPLGQGTITWNDLQAAIWALSDMSPVYNSWHVEQNGLTYNNAWGIIYDVLYGGNHEGYVPACNEKIIAIVYPSGGNMQIISINPTIYNLGLPCVTHCGSICGDGKYGATYPGANTSYKYFRWNFDCNYNNKE